MLARAARRNGQQNIARNYNATCEQLYLPWLCPAYTRPRQPCYRALMIEAGPRGSVLRKRRNSRGAQSSPRRSLATATEYHSRPVDVVPFEGLNNGGVSGYHIPGRPGTPTLANLRHFDPSSPLILDSSLAPPPHRHRSHSAVAGEIEEIMSVLEACLTVGRMERAGVIIKRIATIRELDPEEMIRLQNWYFNVSLMQLKQRYTETGAQAMHQWFELEVREKGYNSETLAYMIGASLLSEPGKRQDRLVRRYMDMAADRGTEVLGSGILSPQNQNTIVRIIPELGFQEGFWNVTEDVTDLEEVISSTHPDQALPATPKDIPEVRPVELKGLGLKSLKQALSLFSDKPEGFDSSVLTYEEKRARQTKLEQDSVQAAIDRWREESVEMIKTGLDSSLQTRSVGARMWKWHEALQEYLHGELLKITESENRPTKTAQDTERCTYGPFLRILPTDKLAAVTILSAMTSLSSQGIDRGLTLSSGIMNLGHSVEEESISECIKKDTTKFAWNFNSSTHKSQRLERFSKGQRLRQYKSSESLAKLIRGKELANADNVDVNWDPQWSSAIKAKVGAFLMSALIETAKIPVSKQHPETQEWVTQMQPAFSHAHQYRLGKKTGMILANTSLVAQIKREPVHSLLAKHLPMVVEPVPWTRFNQGGFVLHPAKVMRVKSGDKDQRHYAEAAVEKGDMEQTFKGLDVLGKTSWRINQPVFDTMLEAWNSGEAIANFPPENPKLEVPPEPEASKDPSERRRWIRAVKAVENARGGYHSVRCFQNFQLEIARALRDEVFYFPHNIDFRGRAYPIPPYLNHMGADHCRGLLMFGEGKRLGNEGLKWLKIHLANVFGFDKASLLERESFAADHKDDIYDSAVNPLKGNGWWLKAEDPWQCLAACIELNAALELEDPTAFVSHLPIHQDGTCNGLQHYAALGGDVWGAKQVNLEPGDRPADVYSAVANLVKESLANDLATGHPCAKILDGKISRKVVKQTVMTNVYGVTFIGAQAQVRRQLVAAYPELSDDPRLHTGILASYIATKIFQGLSTMFGGAHDIQHWLGECASRISLSVTPEQLNRVEEHLSSNRPQKPISYLTNKVPYIFNVEEQMQFKSSVIWTNPLRMPVVQPYRASKSRIVITNLQKISLSEPHSSDPVNKRKQLQGFPPNFIHSLDATHMILSALKCEELGLSFAAVHDSFWTHASDVGKMNGVLRDAFIQMHSEDIIGRLAAEFSARYKGSLYLAKIRPGSEFHARVTQWRKAQRLSKTDDLKGTGPNTTKSPKIKEAMMENRRMRLLNSDDPKEVKKGKKMVTPASIFAELSADADLHNSVDLGGLGDISTSEAKAATDDPVEVDGVAGNTDLENSSSNAEVDNIDIESSMESDSKDSVDLEEEPIARSDSFAAKLAGKKRSHAGKGTWQWAWLPLSFPQVPKKGDFDVSRLKESKYFFS